MAFHDKIGRFAGGFADFLTGNRYDFDGLGKPQDMNLLEKDDDKEKEKGFLDNFLAGLQSYNPEKNKSDYDRFLDSMSKRGFVSGGGGSFAQVGDNLSIFNPDNSAREQAILQQNQQNMYAAAQKKQQQKNVGRMAGTAIGSIFGPVGGAVGGIIGGIFCDIRLKEDIAPLQKSEVNDVLSECAFFVKDLNELS